MIPRRCLRPEEALRVAIAIPQGMACFDRLLQGIAVHARKSGWICVRMPEPPPSLTEWLQGWDGDGVLAALRGPAKAPADIPLVNLVDHQPELHQHLVTMDHHQVGLLAARHLRSRSLDHFAFYGLGGLAYSLRRRTGFSDALAEDRITPLILEADPLHQTSLIAHQDRLHRWIAALPPRTGIFACTDGLALEAIACCRRLGRRIPDDLAVLGVDNDPGLCELADPPLSSIARNDAAAGQAAAGLLHRLMQARRHGRTASPVPRRILIPPAGVVARQSTTGGGRHPLVSAFLQRIEANLSRPVGIGELMDGLPLSRRRLESLFQAETGVSPYQYLLRARTSLAREMVRRQGGGRPRAVASACGFTGPRHLRAALRRFGD